MPKTFTNPLQKKATKGIPKGVDVENWNEIFGEVIKSISELFFRGNSEKNIKN